MEVSHIVNLVLNAFTSFSAIVFNSFTIHALRKTSSLPAPFKTLLLSLAVSDLTAGLLAQPLYIILIVISSKQNTADHALTSTILVIVCALCAASLLSVIALSMDRFLAVHLHLRYKELVTHKRVVGAVILIWILSVGISLVWIWRDIYKVFSLVAIIWSLCFVYMTIVNLRLSQAIKRHRNQIQADLRVQQVAQAVKPRKSAVSALYVYLLVLVCYLPMYCSIILYVVRKDDSDISLFYSRTVMFFNSSLNPIIYCWRIRPIRQTIMSILGNIFSCNSADELVLKRSLQERISTAGGIPTVGKST